MDKGIRKLKKTLQLCLTASLVIIGNSCIDNKYNLDQDISLTVEVGSGLGFPLGSTEEKLLKDLISEEDVDGLIEGDEYSIQKSDVFNSTIEPQHVSIDGINQTVDFNIEFSDLVIDPITVEANHKEASLKSDNPIENVELSPNAASDQSISVTHGSVPQVSDLPAIDIHPTGTNPFVLNINSVSCPEEITSVQKILFAKGNNAEIKIDVKRLKNDLKLSEINLQVIDFTVTFPAAFKLSGTTANGMQISGNKLIISGTTLTDDRIYTFNIDSYTKNIPNNNGSTPQISENITYSLTAKVSGKMTQALDAGSARLGLSFSFAPDKKDMDILAEIGTVNIDMPETMIENKVDITNIPKEIEKIKTVTFESTSTISFSINNIDLKGLQPKNGENLLLQLPQNLTFEPTSGLNTSNNILSIPTTSIANSNQYTKTLTVKSADFTSYPLVSDPVTGKKHTSFTIQMGLKPSKLTLSGEAGKTVSVNDLLSYNNGQTISVIINPTTLTVKDAEVESGEFVSEVKDEKVTFSVSAEAKEIKKLNTVTFTQPVTAKLSVNIKNITAEAGQLHFSSYTINFPKFIKFDPSTGVNANNQLILNDVIGYKDGNTSSKERVYTKDLLINSLDFDGYSDFINNGQISLNEEVTMNGNVVVSKGGTIGLDDLKNISVTATMNVPDMVVKEVTGVVDQSVDPQHEKVDLSDLTEYLKEGSVLDLQPGSYVTLDVKNPIGIPIKLGQLVVSSKKNNQILETLNLAPGSNLIIGAGDGSEEGTESKFWLSETDNHAEGYQWIGITNDLVKLLKEVPDSLVIDIKDISASETDAQGNPVIHKVDIQRNYNVDIKYNVVVPLALGKDLNIVYTDTIKDIHKDLEDITDNVNIKELDLYVDIETSLPMELKLEVNPLGIGSEHKLDGLVLEIGDEGKIQAGNYDPETKQTTKRVTSIPIHVYDKGDYLKELDGLELIINGYLPKGESTYAGAPLRPTQSIKAKVRVKLPKGVEVDIDKL